MTYLSTEDKSFFKKNGYLVKHNQLTPAQIKQAQDALWSGINAKRDQPTTWVNAGPRSPVNGNHPAIKATLFDTPVAAMMRELVGPQLNVSNGPGPALTYPNGRTDWSLPERGHLDGYYTPTNGVAEGTVGCTNINIVIYVEDILDRGGGFTLWPGSHLKAAEYFKNHSQLSLQGGIGDTVMDLGEGLQIVGQAGTVCLWHGQLFHSGSQNCQKNIRMALIGRYARKDINDILFETPDDPWAYWEGIN